MQGQDAVLHLACISNDASFELDENLSETINYDCFEPMVVAAKKAGVKRFVYCSSSSVYGVSDSPDVTEDHPLVPLTLYNKFKGMCEPILWKHKADDFTCVVIRPATVCGYSPRTRLDLSVNILTNHAVNKGVDHGVRRRPDAARTCTSRTWSMPIELMLSAPHEKIHGETFNIGFQNYSIADIADDGEEGGRRGNAGEGRDRDRHDAVERHALLPRQFRQDEARARLQAEAHRSRTRCAISRAPSAIICCRTASTTTGTTMSAR